MMPKVKGLKMVATNAADIGNYGQKVIKFRGVVAARRAGFVRQT